MKIFVKCCSCGHVVYTMRKEILSLVASKEFSCSGCNIALSRILMLLCDGVLGNQCDSCQFRFYCFSSDPVEVGLDN